MIVDIYNTNNKYDLIVADPPWKQTKGGKKAVRPNSSGKGLDYPTCTMDIIEDHLKHGAFQKALPEARNILRNH